jgi:hypothetical protein
MSHDNSIKKNRKLISKQPNIEGCNWNKKKLNKKNWVVGGWNWKKKSIKKG